ncbi:MAG: HNH endonuclease [Candidatus Yanofskybacteria bacterium]|nr:HNH endonuclease [Candidatus Yanofskybacteria bacterium]
MIQFQHPEDREFFANLLTGGDQEKLEKEFSDCFDFRHPAIKRWEFNKIKRKLLKELILKHGGKCQLRIHLDCSKDGKFEPDHIIPLSTNELNKKLRHMARTSSEKVPSQSFGSNDIKNLLLSCKRCNAYKKHKLIMPNGANPK